MTDSTKQELREILESVHTNGFRMGVEKDLPIEGHYSVGEAIEALSQLIDVRVRVAEVNAAAFAITILDRLHNASDGSSETDRLYKGAKNSIRDQFKEETGIDPAPHYPTTYVKLSGEENG